MSLTATFSLTGSPGVSSADPYLFTGALLAGTQGATANRVTIQAWLDGLSSRPAGARATLLIPVGTYWVDRDLVLDMPNVDVVGYGMGRSLLRAVAGHEGSVLRVGTPRLTPATAPHWRDLFGLLDSTIAPAPNQRWGYDLNSDSQIACGPCGFHCGAGDYWGDTSALTIEAAFYGPPPAGPIFGGSWAGYADPFLLKAGAGSGAGRLYFTTDASRTVIQGDLRFVDLPGFNGSLPAGTAHRVIIQLRMDGASPPVSVWVDGVQTTTPALASTLGFPLPATFRASNGMPLKIGAAGSKAAGVTGENFSAAGYLPMVLLGLRVSHGLRYADDGLGTPPRRLDGATRNDLNTFREVDSLTAFVLACDEGPDDSAASRRVPILTPTGRTGGMLLEAMHEDISNIVSGVTIRDLTIVANGTTGNAVSLGFSLSFAARRVEFVGGYQGLGSWPWGPNYPIDVADCVFSGDVPIFTHYATGIITNTQLGDVGRACVWNATSSLTIDGLFFGRGHMDAFYVGAKGAQGYLSHWRADIEDTNYPRAAPFVVENGHASNVGVASGALEVHDYEGGALKPNTPFILAMNTDTAPAFPGAIKVHGPYSGHTTHSCIVQSVTAGAWKGRVEMIRPPWTGYDPSTQLAVGAGAADIAAS
jgi:hypothetical protein